MTTKEFISRLELIADLSEKEVSALANLLIDYLGTKESALGFRPEKDKE